MKPETVAARLIKRYGVRRAMVLFGASALVAVKGWDVLTGDDAYTRQGVWTWKRDLEAAGVDPFAVEWEGFERKVGTKLGGMLERTTEIRKRKAGRVAEKTASK